MNMENSSVELNDLPDEILLMILKKVYNIILLYSLSGVNIRLNKIVHDSVFTNRLTLVNFVPTGSTCEIYSPIDLAYSLSDSILDRFCSDILPKIHEKVKWLDLESSSMERILLSTNYPNLCGIGLYNIRLESAVDLFSDDHLFTPSYKNQISSVILDIKANGEGNPIRDENIVLFNHIFNTFPNLQILNFGPSLIWYEYLSFDILLPTVISSTLLELYVCLDKFSDCLYLLDGRFNKLHTFDVNIEFITSRSVINNKENLPNLRSFTLHCDFPTNFYDELILPLLHRMSNLEKLNLAIIVSSKTTIIDGNNLKLNIVNNMPFLKKFTFNIHSSTHFYNQLNVPSNEYIQDTFKHFENKQIISSIDYFKEKEYSQCHIYSYPYQLKYYNNITNHFPGGIFKCVRAISLFDERPFEHHFFFQIAQSFPLLEKFSLINRKAQNNKELRKCKNENLSMIEYPYLLELDISQAHKDYHEQFLFDTKTCLPKNLSLTMNYQLVKKVTRNFRRITTRSNCAKISFANFLQKSKFPDHLKDYFPNAKIA